MGSGYYETVVYSISSMHYEIVAKYEFGQLECGMSRTNYVCDAKIF